MGHLVVGSIVGQDIIAYNILMLGPPGAGTSSEAMREQVTIARQSQQQRFAGTKTRTNGQMTSRQIRRFCTLDDASHSLLRAAMSELGLSARAHDKVLRVARTIADLDQSETIQSHHLSEAINYRVLDRALWT